MRVQSFRKDANAPSELRKRNIATSLAKSLSVRAGQAKSAERRAKFLALAKAEGVPVPETEYAFARPRKWRFDFAWPSSFVALESEGGMFSRGAHASASGVKRDIEKYNEAALNGWTVLRVTSDKLCTPATIALVLRALR